MKASLGRGIGYAVSAYVLWGVLPLYWKLLAAVAPVHILAFRILFSLLFVGLLLLAKKNTVWLSIFGDRKKRRLVLSSALVVTMNWGLYIWAVNTNHAIEASLGYFINPLGSILLGLVFFRERLSLLQWIAFGLAAAGVSTVTVLSGTIPWISLGLAMSFGVYGLLKKKAAFGSLEGLGAETLAAAPLAAALLIFPLHKLGDLGGIAPLLWLPIALCGIVTAVPLYLFSQGAKLLPLSAIGFIQFINPTFVFLLGVFVFREPFPAYNLAAFGCIWLAALLYAVSLVQGKAGRR
ncbi:MAG: EamA family transporter RarD [Treponema sp.]|jgi:chloramphenicol-sensitive protein RarD|nr:EamA family transporter RarD [Treponema sp.]